jgi:hypothetical protein
MERINDISFTIGDKVVVLLEHQSTINPNMALRLLMYIARVYEKILGDKNIYTTRALRIPRPECFVLYNGTAPYPDEQVLREYLERHASEVMNLLVTEWNWDDARTVWYNEGREEGLEKGREEIAKAALGKGMAPEAVSEITGLAIETIKTLAGQ